MGARSRVQSRPTDRGTHEDVSKETMHVPFGNSPPSISRNIKMPRTRVTKLAHPDGVTARGITLLTPNLDITIYVVNNQE